MYASHTAYPLILSIGVDASHTTSTLARGEMCVTRYREEDLHRLADTKCKGAESWPGYSRDAVLKRRALKEHCVFDTFIGNSEPCATSGSNPVMGRGPGLPSPPGSVFRLPTTQIN